MGEKVNFIYITLNNSYKVVYKNIEITILTGRLTDKLTDRLTNKVQSHNRRWVLPQASTQTPSQPPSLRPTGD